MLLNNGPTDSVKLTPQTDLDGSPENSLVENERKYEAVGDVIAPNSTALSQ